MMQMALWKAQPLQVKEYRQCGGTQELWFQHALASLGFPLLYEFWVQESKGSSLWPSKAPLGEDQLNSGAKAENCEQPPASYLDFNQQWTQIDSEENPHTLFVWQMVSLGWFGLLGV